MRALSRALLALLFLTRGAVASPQDTFEHLEVRVTAVSAGSVYLDQGREAGIRVGDTLRLFPVGAPAVEGVVRSISRTSARASLDVAADLIEVGTLGEVLLPRSRTEQRKREPESPPVPPVSTGKGSDAPADDPTGGGADDEPAEPVRTVPEHPEWEHPPVEWQEDVPLLAPVYERKPEERERRLRGRTYLNVYSVTDDANQGSETTSVRAGLDVTYENPFANGGSLELDGEWFDRSTELPDEEDDEDTRLRLDRLSYSIGGTRDRPGRWIMGRFLQEEVSEFGLLDGAQYLRRRDSGDLWGVSLGFQPEPFDDQDTGDDLQASIFYRWVADSEEKLAVGGGYQKTWHEGAADRDLFLTTLDWRPSARTSLRGTAWVDWYTSGDENKSSGPELTRLHLYLNRTTEAGDGVGLFLSHIRQPEIDRNEFTPITAEQIADNQTSRLGLRGWKNTSKTLRWDGRIEAWNDQDDSGANGEVGFRIRDTLWDDGSVSLHVSGTEGKFSSTVGLRGSATRDLGRGVARLGFHTTSADQDDFSGSQGSLLQHLVRASYDLAIGRKWSLSVFADSRLGDEQDARSLGLFLQRRF